MNEMRAFARSAYPPGTSIHLPGQRDAFGFSAPGPHREKLARPNLHPTEEVDVPNPREHHAMTRVQIDDEHDTFHRHDVGDMLMSTVHSQMANNVLSRSRCSSDGMGMNRSRSLP